MDIVVTPDPARPDRGTLSFGRQTCQCVLGRHGVTVTKKEGDGATPAGRFPLRRVMFRADRIELPQSRLPTSAITAIDGWCGSPDDPAYNKPVALPYGASAEVLWRDDGLYDLVVVLGHNDAPPAPHAGSAIFLHVAPGDGGSTTGCIAMHLSDLLNVLGDADSDTHIIIQPAS